MRSEYVGDAGVGGVPLGMEGTLLRRTGDVIDPLERVWRWRGVPGLTEAYLGRCMVVCMGGGGV